MHGIEPPLDLSVKADPQAWAARLRGRVLPTGSVRTLAQGRISGFPGYTEGAWWVQDAAAALPARLFREGCGRTIADLSAAPGGQASRPASSGARVPAVP